MDEWTVPNGTSPNASDNGAVALTSRSLQDIKTRLHRKLLSRLNLANLETVSRDDAANAIRRTIRELLDAETEQVALNQKERDLLEVDILDEIFGLGPLEPLMKDPEVSDILVNTYKDVWVEKGGKLFATDVRFKDDTHLLQVIDRIVSGVGRRIDDSSPMVDARLPDNSRVNAIIPPLAVDGPHMSIRRFKKDVLSDEDLVSKDAFNRPMLQVLKAIVKGRLNVLISGGTGAGKTTLLNVLSSHIPDDERIVTIEDSAELQLRQRHVVRLETRPPNVEGKGAVEARALVVNSLRMRPDRIIVGEVRGAEAVDMLQAMNTGHDGSISTAHSNSPRDLFARLDAMIGMSDLPLNSRTVRKQIASGIDIVIYCTRYPDGQRKVTSVCEVQEGASEDEDIALREIYRFDRQSARDASKVTGRFCATGFVPSFVRDSPELCEEPDVAALFQTTDAQA